MVIRLISSGDFESLEALDRKCFSDPIRYNRYELAYYLSLENSIGLAKTTNGKLLGFIISTMIDSDTMNIVTIDVEPSARRCGIGTNLIQALKNMLKEWKVSKISLQVSMDNEPAIEFYKKHGFSITKLLPRYYPTNDGYQMECTI
jgi:ribosomal-protein-alanine N-acetyltransferase